MKLIVGLGNPGAKYEGTRHNVGFDVVDILATRWGLTMTTEKFHAWFTQGEFDGEKVVLLKPSTFMNRSGQAVLGAGRFYKIGASDLLVIADDHALPLGRLRMRVKSSAGGHNGLQSVVDYVGSDEWARLRIGIGEPVGVPAVYVLSRFTPEEEKTMKPARKRAADAAECWIGQGAEAAMTKFNGETRENQ